MKTNKQNPPSPEEARAHKLAFELKGYLGATITQGGVSFVRGGSEVGYEPTIYAPCDLEMTADLGLTEKRKLTIPDGEEQLTIEIYTAKEADG
jgi:hypothetical protein